uniref:Transposase n=1 Tax=Rhabditophanes sp. KR3021 TaxID=114890 RepID=A0AC35TW55_9BILA
MLINKGKENLMNQKFGLSIERINLELVRTVQKLQHCTNAFMNIVQNAGAEIVSLVAPKKSFKINKELNIHYLRVNDDLHEQSGLRINNFHLLQKEISKTVIFVRDACKSDLRDVLERSQSTKKVKFLFLILTIFSMSTGRAK